ncbi:MAG TPA: hypothetical protein VFE17_05150 [Candidatus Baltobacteraceae bacterium]|jgi:hypothetical protein|nr:hypothetical protein [Candidatus Baltobacteraceae bacterium]
MMYAVFLLASVATLTPSALVANPTSYEGKPVVVQGKVSEIQKSHSLMGTVTGFKLCDTACVVVIDKTNAAHTDGESATISGTFQTSFKGPKRSFKNVVLVK